MRTLQIIATAVPGSWLCIAQMATEFSSCSACRSKIVFSIRSSGAPLKQLDNVDDRWQLAPLSWTEIQ